MSTFEASRAYIDAGVSIVPGKLAVKMPDLKAGELATYRERFATDEEMQRWFEYPKRIIAVTGSPSGYLEVLDFDEDAETIFPQWQKSVEHIAGYLPTIETPGGGYHIWYRCEVISGSKVIAKDDAGKVRIESKGEKSTVTVPGGHCCDGELPRVQISGPPLPEDIPVISKAERSELWEAARRFDLGGIKELEAKKLKQKRNPVARNFAADQMTTPWDDYNRRCNAFELLESIGWKSKDGQHWTRPGKPTGTSAALRKTQDGQALCFVVFSASVPELNPGTHSLFSVFAAYHHAGDGRSAARTLRTQGYGQC